MAKRHLDGQVFRTRFTLLYFCLDFFPVAIILLYQLLGIVAFEHEGLYQIIDFVFLICGDSGAVCRSYLGSLGNRE